MPGETQRTGRPPGLVLRLYVTTGTPNSTAAIANLHAICAAHARDGHRLDIVDVLDDPLRALADGVIVTPTLVKLAPAPMAKIVGDLSATQRVLAVLGLPPLRSPGGDASSV